MINLLSLAEAKVHLRIYTDIHDADIELKIAHASEIIMNYYKRTTVPEEWVINSSPMTYDIPPSIRAATLLVLGELFNNREASVANILTEAVRNMIPRDPTLA
jgi:Phage QLRG family, putative DNA packaging.